MSDQADVAVVIPCHNAADTIGPQLKALACQQLNGKMQVVVADNGSTDETATVVKRYADEIDDLIVVDASGLPSAGFARNVGAAAAPQVPLLLFTDADDVVAADWVSSMSEALRQYDMVGGFTEGVSLNSPKARRWNEPWGTNGELVVAHGFLPHAIGTNMGIRREVFEAVGGWFDRFPGAAADDVEFSWRVQLLGYSLGPARGAFVHYRYRESIRGVWTQYGRRGQNATVLKRQYRHYFDWDALEDLSAAKLVTDNATYEPPHPSKRVWTVVRLFSSRARALRTTAKAFGWAREQVRYRLFGPGRLDLELGSFLAERPFS